MSQAILLDGRRCGLHTERRFASVEVDIHQSGLIGFVMLKFDYSIYSTCLVGLFMVMNGADVSASDYAVVVSKSTQADESWKAVVDALVEKHDGTVIVYDKAVSETVGALSKSMPQHTCFVATPIEATRDFVAAVHQATRELDDDPYADTHWGILTGYDAANALAIAKHREPLVVKKVASGTELALECVEQGLWYDELVKNKMVQKQLDGDAKESTGPDDTTQALVDTLNDYQADLFVTSGHATEADWMIGFRYRNGFFRSKAGQMYGYDTQQKKIEIESPNPKVYLPIGNCLMGHINGPDAMALAWMNDVGVKQMVGYTVPTWYGYGGWGLLDYFVEQPGRYTLNDAFMANHHALIHRLAQPSTNANDKRGLTFDRDVVAFYGDPAWSATMSPGKTTYQQELTENNGVYTFQITPLAGEKSFDTVNNNGAQRGGRPIVGFFPSRMKNIKVIEGTDLNPTIADDFILIPRPKTCDPNKPYRVRFSATVQ